ncbi:hypothetical protein BGX28_003808, partial [Mortierella sp. GBA30]
MHKCDVVKSATGFHRQTTLSVGQLGRKVSHVVLTQQIGTDDPVDIKTLIAAKVGTATIKTIRRFVRVANGLLRHGQKVMVLFIASATPEDLHLLKDAICHKHQPNTADDAIEQAAKKRLQKLGNAKNNSHGGGNHNSSSGNLLVQEDEEANHGGDSEGHTDNSGSNGDYGGVIISVLSYLRSPTLTIKYNNKNIALVSSIRSGYLKPIHCSKMISRSSAN